MSTSLFHQIFPKPKSIIAMVHVFHGEEQQQIDQALEDAEKLEQGGVDALLVENYGCGYLDSNRATKETAKRLITISLAIRKQSKLPIGLNILPNDYWQAFPSTQACGGSFIQLDHITGHFIGHESVDPETYAPIRQAYPGIAVLGGIHPKYYSLTNPNCSLADCATKAMELTDAIVITGNATGDPTRLDDLKSVRNTVGDHPIVIGSGLNPENAVAQLSIADGAIVGSAFKQRGVRKGTKIDISLVKKLMDQVAKIR